MPSNSGNEVRVLRERVRSLAPIRRRSRVAVISGEPPEGFHLRDSQLQPIPADMKRFPYSPSASPCLTDEAFDQPRARRTWRAVGAIDGLQRIESAPDLGEIKAHQSA